MFIYWLSVWHPSSRMKKFHNGQCSSQARCQRPPALDTGHAPVGWQLVKFVEPSETSSSSEGSHIASPDRTPGLYSLPASG